MGGGKGGGGSAKIDVSEYYRSIHMGVCAGPVEAMEAIYIGEKEAWTGVASNQSALGISRTDLFGGIKKEGGVAGQAHFMPGSPSGTGVTMPENLAKRLGRTSATCPAFTGLCNLFFVSNVSDESGGFYWGANNPYIKTVWAKVRRRSNIFPAKAGEPSNYYAMGSEANPAHMIYECLVNTEWGMGASPAIIDVGTFQDCAKTFYLENFGLSMIWAQQTPVENFISEILDHVQAALFVNPRTGLLTLKAVRDDYNPADLEELNPNNCKVTRFQRKAWGETINEVTVSWTNPLNEKDETITIHDLANIEMQGNIVSTTRNYYGIRSAALASMVAARDIRSAAAPLASFDIEADRTVWSLLPGGVVKLSYPELGISNLILRIGNIDYGKPGDSKIRISAIEDIFGLPQSAYTVPSESSWQDESQPPTNLDYLQIMTLPVYFAVRVLQQYAAAAIDYPEVLVGVVGATENRDTRSFELYGTTALPTGILEMTNLGTKPVTSRSILQIGLRSEESTTLSSADLALPYRTVGAPPTQAGFILIGEGDDEHCEIALISYLSSDMSVMTIERGVLDTTPKEWPAGTPIWYLESGAAWGEETVFSDGGSVEFKALPTTSLGTLQIDDAPTIIENVSGRPYYPTRPGDVKVLGVGFDVVFTDAGLDIGITWANRNRLTEDSQVVLWSDGEITPEVGQTTTITVLDMDRNVLTAHDGLAGNSFLLPSASFAGSNVAIVRVTAKRDGFESLQGHEVVVSFGSGYGTNYGNNYGDN